MYYYEVALGANKHFGKPTYTYSYHNKLREGTLVQVSFGKSKKIGMIDSVVDKPTYPVKALLVDFPLQIGLATKDFIAWYSSYYLVEKSIAYGQLLPNYLTVKSLKADAPKKVAPASEIGVLPELSQEQSKAYEKIMSSENSTILHGITGSGKTRIYQHIVAEQLKRNKNSLLLLPEIALTPQIISEFEKIAPVIAFHSEMTQAERAKAWVSALTRKKPCVVIGPRSCLFLPLAEIGAIIVDEAHEPSYKQDSEPRYHALYVAAGLAKAHDARLILGSATPPVTEVTRILDKKGTLVCVHDKAIVSEESEVLIVDGRKRSNFTRHSQLSDTMLDAVKSTLDAKRQSLLFINRRGTSKLVLCKNENCSYAASCSNCDLALTFHHDSYMLICHTCGRSYKMEPRCPLSGDELQLRSLGSKAFVEELSSLFPDAKIARFDSDTAKDSSFLALYESVRSGTIDILVGTQQLIKGLDLPKLSLVGLLNADLSLHFPDYSSDERTFQIITQALGRVGRGHGSSKVVLQTYQPESPLIEYAIKEDWHGFYTSELEKRQRHKMPPALYTAKLLFRDARYDKALKDADSTLKALTRKTGIVVEGPIPAYIPKVGQHYYVQLHVSSKSRTMILNALKSIPKNVLIDLDPITLL